MPDVITPTERRLIDLALKRGQVKKIPFGVFAIDAAAKKTREETIAERKRLARSLYRSKANAKQAPWLTQALKMLDKGNTYAEISEFLNLSKHTIRYHIKKHQDRLNTADTEFALNKENRRR